MRKIQATLILLGIVVFGFAIFSAIKAIEISGWPNTEANLEYAIFHSAWIPAKGGGGKARGDYASTKYTYSLDGKSYIGSRTMLLEHIFLPKEALDALKPGKINIYYEARNPKNSFIYATFPTTQIIMLSLVAVFMFLLGLFFTRFVRLLRRYFKVG